MHPFSEIPTRPHNLATKSLALGIQGASRAPHCWCSLGLVSPCAVAPTCEARVPIQEADWKWKWSHSVVSYSLRPQGLQPTRLLCPWDFPGKSTGVGCYSLLLGIFPTQGSNSGIPHCKQTLYRLSRQGIEFLVQWSSSSGAYWKHLESVMIR